MHRTHRSRLRALIFLCVLTSAYAGGASAQDTTTATGRVTIVVMHDSLPVPDAVVRSGRFGARTDTSGRATLRLPAESRSITVARIGFRPDTLLLAVRAGMDTTLTAVLFERAAAIASVIVTSTRAERRIQDEPLRVEVLSGDDITEKNEMRPGDLRTLFSEMGGTRVQTTSSSLGAAALRVQGLPGRYTLVLNDGLPLYGTRATSFGLVQQPPLDLRQAEVIKGTASALYGPAALAGVVNLVSRRPPDTSQALVNQTAHGGTDALGFVAKSLARGIGLTVLAGGHYQRATDPDKDAWVDVTGFRRAELRPRFFYDGGAGRSLMVTAGGFTEARGGGATAPRAGATSAPALQDSLSTRHADIGAVGRLRLSDTWSLAARTAANVQEHRRLFAGNRERERQQSSFGEITATAAAHQQTLIVGLSYQREAYRNRDVPQFDQALTTPAVFAQHDWTPAPWMATALDARCDLSDAYGTICTPRVSLLVKPADAVSVRASAGAGWFAPMALNDETESIGLSRVTMPSPLEPERARSASLDVTAARGPLEVNATVFQNRVSRPVGLRRVAGDTTGAVELVNAPGALRTYGGALFAIYDQEPVIATAYYAVTHGREFSPESGLPREVPYTPRREAGLDLALEDDESGAYVAAEVFYTGVQSLEGNPYRSLSRPYTTVGLLGAKRWHRTTIFLNLENLTNVLQTRVDPILRPAGSGAGDGGAFAVAPWAPLEGRTANAGIRYAF